MLQRLGKKENLIGFIKNNLFYSGVSYGFRLFVNLIIFALLARYFNVSNFGKISFYMVIVNLLSICIDLGYRLLIVRELSIKRSLLSMEYLNAKISLKIMMLFLSGICLFIYAYLNNFWDEGVLLMISILMSAFFLNLCNTVFAIFQSFNKYIYESLSLFVMVFFLSISLIISRRPGGISIFLYGYSISMLLTFLFSWYLLRLKIVPIQVSNFKIPSFSFLKKELFVILPFASIIILEALNNSFDTFFVEKYCSNNSLGEYSAFLRVLSGLTIFSTIIASASMPILSRATSKGAIKSKTKVFLIYFGMVLSGFMIFLLYYIFNEEIIRFLLGEKYLFLLEWDSLIFIMVITSYMRVLPGMFLVTYNKEKARSYLTAILLIYGLVIFYYALPGYESDIAVRTIVNIKIVSTIVLLIYFGYLVIIDTIKKKNSID